MARKAGAHRQTRTVAVAALMAAGISLVAVLPAAASAPSLTGVHLAPSAVSISRVATHTTTARTSRTAHSVRTAKHVTTLAKVKTVPKAKAKKPVTSTKKVAVTVRPVVTATVAAVAAAAAVSVTALTPVLPPAPVAPPTAAPTNAAVAPVGPTTPAAPTTGGVAPVVASVPALSDQAPLTGVFGASSVWQHNDLTDSIDNDSPAMVAGLAHEVTSTYGNAALNVWAYNVSYYTAAPGTPRVTVHWDDCQNKGYTPDGLFGPGGQFTDVPVPAGVVPAVGGDGELTISDPSTDQLWEFWQAKNASDGLHACWGGRIDHVSTSPGYFPQGFGASASEFAVGAGAVTLADVAAGSINHALTLNIPDAAQYQRYVFPAHGSDGDNSSSDAIPMGTRLRLDPSINVDSLHLTKLGTMIAKAAQKYGFIVSDSAGAVAVITESGAGVQAATGTNPWDAILGGTPDYMQLQGFPWAGMQALVAPTAH